METRLAGIQPYVIPMAQGPGEDEDNEPPEPICR